MKSKSSKRARTTGRTNRVSLTVAVRRVSRDAGARPLESLGDEQLVAAMRTSEPAALAEFFARFAPTLVRVAARLRVDGGRRDECVTELLGDVAMRIVEHRVPRMRSLTDFLVRSLRNKVLNERKGDGRRERWEAEAMRVLTRADGFDGEGVVASLMSAYSRRAADGAGDTPGEEGDEGEDRTHAAKRRLLDALGAEMTEEEKQVMSWLGEWTEQRVIAGWLGETYDNFRVRLHRLRARLVVAARHHLAGAAAEDRAVIRRVIGCALNRTGRPARTAKATTSEQGESPSDAAKGDEP